MKECVLLAVWLNDDADFFLECCGDDYHELIFLNPIGPLDEIEGEVRNAAGRFRRRGWLVSDEQVEGAVGRLHALWAVLESFGESIQTSRRKLPLGTRIDWRV